MNRLRMVKEKEVIAAVDAFSHTKSLKSLMEEVHHSTIEVRINPFQSGVAFYIETSFYD